MIIAAFRRTAVIVSLLLVGACAPSGGGAAATQAPSGPPAAPAAAAGVTVQMTDALKFDPQSVTIPRGGTVTWRNTSQTMHTVTDDASKAASSADAMLPSGAQPWDSGNVDPGMTFAHTFDVPGTYKYFCQPHEAAGMVGTITVIP